MKTLVIGDIHGYYRELTDALANASYEEGDQLIFLGDYIDGGPQGRQVIEYLESLKNKKNVFLRGNHEELFLRAVQGDTSAYDVLMYNGFTSTLKSYGVDPQRLSYSHGRHYINRNGDQIHLNGVELMRFLKGVFPAEHLRFIERTGYYFQTDSTFFSHAGAEPCRPLHEQSGTDFTTGSDRFFLKQRYNYGKTLVFGHFHLMDPLVGKRKICLGMEHGVRILLLNHDVTAIVDSDGEYREVSDEWFTA